MRGAAACCADLMAKPDQTGPAIAARRITATEREWPQSGQELSRAQEWCSAAQLAHRYERCSRTSLLMPTSAFCSPWNRSMAGILR
jgi:hypothetical protein